MIRARRLALLLSLAALLAGTFATAPAEAAKRKVPFGFFGAVIPPELESTKIPDAVLDQQLGLMARSGVESVRVTFGWDNLESGPGQYNLARVDRLVRLAAAHHLQLVINVTSTPRWASSKPNGDYWSAPPKDPAQFGALMTTLAARYGPTGSFWATNPGMPREPVRRWQVWNEQNAPWYWAPRQWATGYTKLLKSAYQSIKAVDKGATVVAGSLVATTRGSQWVAMKALYKAGAKPWFDEIAIHPYTNNEKSVDGTIDQVMTILRLVRKETRKARDGRVPISLTEVSWPASVGKIPKKALLGLETNTKGQKQRIKAGYERLVKVRRKYRITSAYWYTWATQYDRKGALSVMSFRYAGLTRIRNGTFKAMPLLRTYTSLARRYEGCRKSADARRCG